MTYSPSTISQILASIQHTIVGRAGADPSVKYMDSGKSVAKVRIAVNNGRDVDSTWFTVEAWDALAQQLADHCAKGSMLRVTGRIVENHWQTKAGEDRLDLIIKAQDVTVLQASNRQPAAASSGLPF